MRPSISERRLVFLIGAGFFINALDFTMVLPLGPLAAMLSAQIVSERPDGSLAGIDGVVWLAIALTFVRFAHRSAAPIVRLTALG